MTWAISYTGTCDARVLCLVCQTPVFILLDATGLPSKSAGFSGRYDPLCLEVRGRAQKVTMRVRWEV